MIADKYSVQLSDYCFGVCEVVKNLDESVSIELEDLGRCVFLHQAPDFKLQASPSSLFCNSRVFGEIARTIRRGSNVPRLEYDKDKIEGHKSEIQKILSALNAPTSSSPKDSAVVPLPDELVAQRPPIVSSDPTAASASQSGKDCPRLTGLVPNSDSVTQFFFSTFVSFSNQALDRTRFLTRPTPVSH